MVSKTPADMYSAKMGNDNKHTWISESHDRADLLHCRSRQIRRGEVDDLRALGVAAHDDLRVGALAEGEFHEGGPISHHAHVSSLFSSLSPSTRQRETHMFSAPSLLPPSKYSTALAS